MGFIGSLILGLIVGAVAKWIMPGRDPGGIIVTMIIGVVGGFIGGWIGRLLPFGGGSMIFQFILAVVGALILLGGYRLIKK